MTAGDSHQASRREVWANLPFFQITSGADTAPPRRGFENYALLPDGIAFYSKNSAAGHPSDKSSSICGERCKLTATIPANSHSPGLIRLCLLMAPPLTLKIGTALRCNLERAN